MADVRTTFTIEAKAKGFADVIREKRRLDASLATGGQKGATGATTGAGGGATPQGRSALEAMRRSAKGFGSDLAKAWRQVTDVDKALKATAATASRGVAGGFKSMSTAMGAVRTQINGAWEAFRRFAREEEQAHRKRRSRKKGPVDDQYGPIIPGPPPSGGGGGGGGRGRRGGRGGGGGEEREQARGSFTQGFIEGALPGSRIIDRGPGAFRQATGIMAGSALRNAASLPFTGGTLGGVIGSTFGVLGAPIQRLEEQAQQRIGFERQQVGLSPFLGGFGVTSGLGSRIGAAQAAAGLTGARAASRVAQARAAAEQAVPSAAGKFEVLGNTMLRPKAGTVADDLTQRQAQTEMMALQFQNAGIARRRDALAGTGGYEGLPLRRKLAINEQARRELQVPEGGIHDRYRRVADSTRIGEAGKAAADRTQAAIDKEKRDISRGVSRSALDPLMQAGQRYGAMSLSGAQQFAAQMAQAGGGTARDIQKQGMLNQAFAAQTALGIGPQTSGAFMQAGRSGGTNAGPGKGGEQLENAIQDGMRLGLQGSELTDYMQSMASNIEAWKSTGIPLAADSIGSLGRSLEKNLGLTGARAAGAAVSAAGKIQSVGKQGIQDSTDYLTAQVFGGLKDDGSNYFESMGNLEELKNQSPGDLRKSVGDKLPDLIRKLSEGGGDIESSTRVVERGLGKFGINMGYKELMPVVKQAQGLKLTPEEQKQADARQSMIQDSVTSALGGSDYKATARARSGGIVGAETARENTQLMHGASMIPSVQTMNKAADEMAGAFTKLGPLLGEFAKGIESIVNWMTTSRLLGGAGLRQSGGP